jgi:thioredoxin reductase
MYDVIIIGGGPAGLNAALVLGRCRRAVLICDNSNQRNIKAKNLHAYLTRDGINPNEFLQIASMETVKYDIKRCMTTITSARKLEGCFELISDKGESFLSKKLLLATGVQDNIPQLPGIEELYGVSVHHCPYCDGWEVKEKALAVYAKGKPAFSLARSLKTWSDDVILFTDGSTELSLEEKSVLNSSGIKIIKNRIKKIEGENGYLRRIVFFNNEYVEREAMFFSAGHFQKSNLAFQLGCRFSRKGHILTNLKQKTSVEGVFAAGDAARDIQFVIVAASEGAKAGVAINIELQEEEFHIKNIKE